MAAALLASGMAVGCGGDGGGDSSSGKPPSDALSQMEIAFEGNPSEEDIKSDLDQAFDLYGVPATEQNYSRAGSSLVALRKKTGVPEMKILKHTIRIHTPGVAVKLPDAFGLAATDLRTRE